MDDDNNGTKSYFLQYLARIKNMPIVSWAMRNKKPVIYKSKKDRESDLNPKKSTIRRSFENLDFRQSF